MRTSHRATYAILLIALATAAASCRQSAAAPATPTPAADLTASVSAPAAVGIAEDALDILVLEPQDVATVASRLMVDTGGWLSNEDASRRYVLGYWGKIAETDVHIETSVQLFHDVETARAGFDRWVSDWYRLDMFAAWGTTAAVRDERLLENLGDEAALVSLSLANQGELFSVSFVAVRVGELVGAVHFWSEGDAAFDAAAEHLAPLLARRFEEGLAGTLVAEPVPIPGEFRPWARPPTPVALADTSLRTSTSDLACPGEGKRVCLMVVGEELGVDLEALAQYFRDTYDLRIDVMPPFSLEGRGAYSADLVEQASQRVASGVVLDLIIDVLPQVERDDEVTLVVLTAYDFYSVESLNMNYHYLSRSPGAKIALISVARFNDAAFGLPANEPALWSRTLKLVTREIGVLHYDLAYAPAEDRISVMQTFPAPPLIDYLDQYLPISRQ